MTRVGQHLRRVLGRRAGVIGINRRNAELVYPHNRRADYPLADDKLVTKECLAAAGVATPELLGVCDGLYGIGAMVARLAGRGDFVIKPARGSGGNGILVIGPWRANGVWERPGGERLTPDRLTRHIANTVFGAFSKDRPDRAYAEERVAPHPVYHALYGDGLCDVRIITIAARPLMAMVRIPTAASGGRANLHQGGVGLAIDLRSGRSYRAWHRGAVIEAHPQSGAPLLGIDMPAWDATVATARAAALALPLGYLGVDIVVDSASRPLVLEVNARPGLEIQNVVGTGLAAAIGAGTIDG